MSLKIRMYMLAFLFSFNLGGGTDVQAEPIGKRAKNVEAAFLLHFTNYVKWPESAFSSPDAPIIVGIFGRDPFGSILDTIARTRVVDGRKVEIRRYHNLASLSKCHILFITSSRQSLQKEILKIIGSTPVLLVGDSADFLQYGAINFVMVDNKIRFNINRENFEKYGLQLSSKLLKVAHDVF